MSFESRKNHKLLITSLVGGALFIFAAADATAQCLGALDPLPAAPCYSLSGNSRAQIGNGLPIPIGFTAAPDGRIAAIPGAGIFQTTGPDPKAIFQSKSQLIAPGNPVTLPVFASNTMVFQVKTAIPIFAPSTTGNSNGTGASIRAGGRTGPAVVTWCPGQPLPTAAYNPACTNPVASGAPTTGRMRYSKTTNQFGAGAGSGLVLGTADVAIRLAGTPPCTMCLVAMALATPQPTGVQGVPFGVFVSTMGMAAPSGRFYASVTANGFIPSAGVKTVVGDGLPNPAVSFGGPNTTGQIVNSALSTVAGGTERFTRTGSDNRVAGQGTLSLISAAVSQRGLSGPNANRGWSNFTIPEPATAASAMGALVVLAGCHALVRRRRR